MLKGVISASFVLFLYDLQNQVYHIIGHLKFSTYPQQPLLEVGGGSIPNYVKKTTLDTLNMCQIHKRVRQLWCVGRSMVWGRGKVMGHTLHIILDEPPKRL